MSTVIKTSLFYIYGEQMGELKTLIPEAIEKFFPNGGGSITDILAKVPKLGYTPKLDVEFEALPQKHKKTFLLYFSEKEHKEFNDYLNKHIKDLGLNGEKKKARTQFIIELLKKVLNK